MAPERSLPGGRASWRPRLDEAQCQQRLGGADKRFAGSHPLETMSRHGNLCRFLEKMRGHLPEVRGFSAELFAEIAPPADLLTGRRARAATAHLCRIAMYITTSNARRPGEEVLGAGESLSGLPRSVAWFGWAVAVCDKLHGVMSGTSADQLVAEAAAQGPEALANL